MEKLFSIFKGKTELLVLLITMITILLVSIIKFEYKKFPYGEDKEVVEQMRKQEGLIISSLGVQGFNNFNIMSYSGRPYYISTQNLIEVRDNLFIDVYCNSIFQNIYVNKLDKQRECFDQRTPELWKYIGEYLGATSIIVNSSISANLLLLAETKNFKLYSID